MPLFWGKTFVSGIQRNAKSVHCPGKSKNIDSQLFIFVRIWVQVQLHSDQEIIHLDYTAFPFVITTYSIWNLFTLKNTKMSKMSFCTLPRPVWACQNITIFSQTRFTNEIGGEEFVSLSFPSRSIFYRSFLWTIWKKSTTMSLPNDRYQFE